MSVQPIRPDEIASLKTFPDQVIEAFNELIVEKMVCGTAIVMVDDAINRIVAKMHIPRQTLFDKHYLDVEDVYRSAGWKVVFDKPGFNETYKAFYTFEVRP